MESDREFLEFDLASWKMSYRDLLRDFEQVTAERDDLLARTQELETQNQEHQKEVPE